MDATNDVALPQIRTMWWPISSLLILLMVGSVAGCGNRAEPSATPQSSAADHSESSGVSDDANKDLVEDAPAFVSREPPSNAAPLGLEVGFANISGVRATIGSITELQDQGTNQFSGGSMLRSDGAGLGVDGLSNLVLIFDKADVLVGVIMTLPKAPTDMLKKLSTKYSVADNRIDSFMDNGYARLTKGDSLVEIDAPHLSFTMEVRYLTNQLMADFQAQSAAQKAARERQQTDKM